MTERLIRLEFISRDEYYQRTAHILTPEQVAIGSLYTALFRVENGDAEAATTAIRFDRMAPFGPHGVRSQGIVYEATFFDADLDPAAIGRGVMRSKFNKDWILLDHALAVVPPQRGVLKYGHVIPHDDGVDREELEREQRTQPLDPHFIEPLLRDGSARLQDENHGSF